MFSSRITEAESRPATLYCNDCRKKFQSLNAYTNHLQSKKHKGFISASEVADEPATKECTDNEDLCEQTKDVLEGLEQQIESDSESSSGWRTVHSDDEDNDSIDFDESKAIPSTSCLFCLESSSDMESNITHMAFKHGFSIPDYQYCVDVPGLLNYLGLKIGSGCYCIACNHNAKPFADVYSVQRHMRDKNHCYANLEGENITEYLDFYDYSDLMAESDDAGGDDILLDEGAFLTLPSGAKIGHRSLMRYFRQSLNAVQRPLVQRKMLSGSHIKALGWTGASGSIAVQRARDIKFMKRIAGRYELKSGVKSNKFNRMIVPRYFRLFGVVNRSGVCRICSPYSAAAASSAVKPEGVPLEQGPPIVPPGETEPEISPRVQELADQILNLSLLQAADLNKVLKKKLKISDAPMMPAGMMMAAMNKKPSAKPAEEKKGGVEEKKVDKRKVFSVKLVKFDDAKKITLIKQIRDLIPGLNLVQAKKFIESAPVEVKGDLGPKDAEDLKAKLEAVGGTVELE
ncbi:c2H2 type zinc-finger (2 copies) domain-containing protein [Ditylenchus destructor]|uniref:C2H2 type zinc-finger (2 copies) domain-containing protein n=1 Tax=Ditylenchus destructor TaxID=166010 RepID=A0AAD4N9J5_9BILA|nr:c2H2 type zinc-finger (2 copies) domain-containing protein [Ditylenchus destructor]